jgi:hypothetical protein
MSNADLDAMGLTSAPKTVRKRVPKSPKPPVEDEDHLHYAVAKLLSLAISRPGICSLEGVCWFSLEGRAKRSIYEGARNKRRGCISGVPDILIVWMGKCYWIELKRAKGGRVSDAQIETHAELDKAGSNVAICRSWGEIQAALVKWKIPHRRVQCA